MGISGRMSAVTYKQGQNPRSTFVFARSQPDDDLHFVQRVGNGSWKWGYIGAPSGTTVKNKTAALAYPDGPVHRLRVFATGANGHLFCVYPSGPSTWQWIDMGKPVGTDVVGSPAAVTYEDVNLGRQIHVFVRGGNGHLFVNHYNGYEWKWGDLGVPQGTSIAGNPSAVAFQDGADPSGVYVFAKCTNNTLGLYRIIGGQGAWPAAQPGKPASGALQGSNVDDFSFVGVASYKEGGDPRRVYCFVSIKHTQGGGDGQYSYYSKNVPQQQWQWSGDLTGDVNLVPYMGDTVTYKDGIDPQITHVYFSSHGPSDVVFPTVYDLWWNGAKWSLDDKGEGVDSPPAAITYKDGASPRVVEVFRDSYGSVWWGHPVGGGFDWDNLGAP